MGIRISKADDSVIIQVDSKNQGKFRLKRTSSDGSWTSANKEQSFDSDVYLEWQVGYDVPASKKKSTRLNGKEFAFTGAKEREKYPYEISEILYDLVSIGATSKIQLVSIGGEIEEYNEFFPQSFPQDSKGSCLINRISFEKFETALPTYFFRNSDGTYMEVIVQKQQYAYGTQPMVYFCVPMESFSNGNEVIGVNPENRPSVLEYTFTADNVEIVYNLFKVLAMASPNHKKDVLAIFEVLRGNT